MGRTLKRPDRRPSRLSYWSEGRLKKNKIKRLMKSNCMTEAEATKYWYSVRRRHH